MNPELTSKLYRWGARLAAVTGYLTILGMIATGIALIGLALLLMLFSHLHDIPLACMLSGTLFTTIGSLTLAQQLHRTYTTLKQQL